jgi:Peptidase family S41.
MKLSSSIAATLTIASFSLVSCATEPRGREDVLPEIIVHRPELAVSQDEGLDELPGPCPSLKDESSPRGADPVDDALFDIDYFFDAARWAYAGYFDFGGERAFEAARARAKAAVASGELASRGVDGVIADSLDFVQDGHLVVGRRVFVPERALCVDDRLEFLREGDRFFLREGALRLEVASVDGLPPAERIRASIAADGRLVHRLVFYGPLDSPSYDTAAGRARLKLELLGPLGIKVRKTVAIPRSNDESIRSSDARYDDFGVYESRGSTVMYLRRLWVPTGNSAAPSAEDFAASGPSLASASPLVADIRRNGGGIDEYACRFFEGLDGSYPDPYLFSADRRSYLAWQLAKKDVVERGLPPETVDRWRAEASEGARFAVSPRDAPSPGRRSGLTLVVSDRGVASSGESLLGSFRMRGNCLVVGAPTMGCGAYGCAFNCRMPRSGIAFRFGFSRMRWADPAEETVGHLPDLWLPANLALDRALAFIERYGEESIEKALRLVEEPDA